MSPTRDVVGASDLDVFADTLADVIAGQYPADELNRLPGATSPAALRIREAYAESLAARLTQGPPARHGGPLPEPLPHQGESVLDHLGQLTVDWNDFEAAGEATRDVVQRLADDKESLRKLVYDVEHKPELLAMCERHQLLDYIVLYDALDRGIRLRLHISTDDHFDRPHDHRFSFSSRILTGGYTHTWYHMDGDLYGDGPDPEARQYLSRHHPDPRPTATWTSSPRTSSAGRRRAAATRCTTAPSTPRSPRPTPSRSSCAGRSRRTGR